MVPKPRKPGQTGGGGYRNQGPSMGRSVSRGGRPHAGGGGGGKKGGCCPMVAAVRSVKQGRFRLARRYAGLSMRSIGRRINDVCGLDYLRA